MASLSEAYESVNSTAHRQDPYENPQTFHRLASETAHPTPARHVLGLVGGNEVAFSKANMIDVESDLQGITRANSDCTGRHHLPNTPQVIVRNTPKEFVRVDTATVPLKPTQMWAYPAVIAPEPLVKETCGAPHKY
jgi:hypothetical protein